MDVSGFGMTLAVGKPKRHFMSVTTLEYGSS